MPDQIIKMPQRKPASQPTCWYLPPLLVVLLTVIAYCNSFTGPFIYDDLDSIRYNPDFGGQTAPANHAYAPILQGGPPSSTTLTSRPISGSRSGSTPPSQVATARAF